ncbi:hypothetical protein I5M32_11015 [Pedobacter sp. SD-b]|uniref:DUF4251 domain-containing protein n=1 Tax=Pedobacter segetis TaxID=2793069 RepID=A0ABS1BL37_9SPHI|nr:hypothetical protein [Pedobacter segetis]MBK0383487.1 hypothetical protein [Pedobacter segetis]
MKNSLILILSFLSIGLFAQDKTVSLTDFKINGMNFVAKKNDIIKVFGNPKRIFEPKYECGFLSEDEQGKKFYSLVYSFFVFTGNPIENYQLEKVNFSSKANFKITYKGKSISSRTTKKDIQSIFEIKVIRDKISFSEPKGESKLIFKFKNGLLSNLEYWTPC